MKTLYLANPYGFSRHQRETLLPPLVTALRSLGCQRVGTLRQKRPIQPRGGRRRVSHRPSRLRDVRKADGFFAVVNGCPPDEGVMVELGVAIALGKPIFLFRDDFRRSSDSDTYPLNLMIFAGLPETGWEDSLYASLTEISDPTKALAQWLGAAP